MALRIAALPAAVLVATIAAADPVCPALSEPMATRRMDELLRRHPPAPEERPVLLFVPGTPGSRLVRRSDRKTVFGRGRVDAADVHLADARNRDVDAEVLEEYEALGGVVSVDVYEDTLRQLRAAVGETAEVRAWGYDWRLGAAELAERLQQYVANLAGRDVVVLAHSYGGVVAWQWQQAHDPAAAGVEHLVLLGVPLRGTCETARFLIEGYKPAVGLPSDAVVGLGHKVLLGELRAAAFTFPATWQLLPREGCVEAMRRGGEPTPLAAGTLEFWKDGVGRHFVRDAWEELEVAPQALWDATRRAMEEAARATPDPAQRRVRNVRAFYSGDYATPRVVRVVVDDAGRVLADEAMKDAGLGDDNPVLVTAAGDGRVLACDPPDCPLRDVCVDRIRLDHGQLADSEHLRAYVRYVLPATLRALAVRAVLRRLPADAALPEAERAALRREVAATGTDPGSLEQPPGAP